MRLFRRRKEKLNIPWRWAVLILLAAYLALTVFWLAQDVISISGAGGLIRRHHLGELLGPRPAVSTMPTSAIQDWMTFAYLDRTYDLAPGFLRRRLSINDGRYPDLSIAEYAERSRLNRAALLEETRRAVQDELDSRAANPLPAL